MNLEFVQKDVEFKTDDFINPLSNKTEELTVYILVNKTDAKYVCVHGGKETVVFMNSHARWVDKDNMETPLTSALGSLIEHHSA